MRCSRVPLHVVNALGCHSSFCAELACREALVLRAALVHGGVLVPRAALSLVQHTSLMWQQQRSLVHIHP